MREMVYDDTRWVPRLQLMGCWNETEARQRAEAARRKRSETLQNLHQEQARRVGIGVNGTPNGPHTAEQPGRSSVTIFDAAAEGQGQAQAIGDTRKTAVIELDDGFDAMALTHREKTGPVPSTRCRLKAQDIQSSALITRVSQNRNMGRSTERWHLST